MMAKVTQFVNFHPVPIMAKDAASVPYVTTKPTKLIEVQVGQDLEICEVHVGSALLKDKAWEGREVEANIKVSVIVRNMHETDVRFAQGGWFLETEEELSPPAAQAPPPVHQDATSGLPQTPVSPTVANPHPCATGNGAAPVYPGANEVAVCLTTEQAKRVLYVLKGGMLHPLEVYGIQGPFERALRSVGINP